MTATRFYEIMPKFDKCMLISYVVNKFEQENHYLTKCMMGFLASKQKSSISIEKGMFSVWRLQKRFDKKMSYLLNCNKSYLMQNVYKTTPYVTFSVLAILILKSTISSCK